MFVLVVILKDDERTYRKKFLCYDEEITVSENDKYIKQCIQEALEDFQGEPDDITIQITMTL